MRKKRTYRKTEKYKKIYERNKKKIAEYTKEYNRINKEKIKELRGKNSLVNGVYGDENTTKEEHPKK